MLGLDAGETRLSLGAQRFRGAAVAGALGNAQ